MSRLGPQLVNLYYNFHMNTGTRTLELPVAIFEAFINLAEELNLQPAQALANLVDTERARLERIRIWRELVKDVQQSANPLAQKSKEEIVEHMSKTRQTIWGAEYAHLYR